MYNYYNTYHTRTSHGFKFWCYTKLQEIMIFVIEKQTAEKECYD